MFCLNLACALCMCLRLQLPVCAWSRVCVCARVYVDVYVYDCECGYVYACCTCYVVVCALSVGCVYIVIIMHTLLLCLSDANMCVFGGLYVALHICAAVLRICGKSATKGRRVS